MSKYFNKMDFVVRFRKVWELNSPSVALQPGEQIDGPDEYLSQYSFLNKVPFDFHLVPAQTDFTKFYNIDIEKNVTIKAPNIELVLKKTPTVELKKEEPIEVEEKETASETLYTINTNIDVSKLPFDPTKVNWLTIKLKEVEDACKILNIDISSYQDLDNKAKKWELIKLIKNSLGIQVNK